MLVPVQNGALTIMTRKSLPLLLGLAVLTASGLGHAGKFYKWVDSNGVTHYTESPPPEGADGQEVRTRNTASSDADAAREALQNDRASQLKAIEEQAEKAQAEKEAYKPEQDNAFIERCKQHRANLKALREQAQLRTKDPETGELIPLDDAGREALIKQSEEALKGCP